MIGHDRASVPALRRTRLARGTAPCSRQGVAASARARATGSQREPEETGQSWRSADPGGAAGPAQNLGQRELNLLSQTRRHTQL